MKAYLELLVRRYRGQVVACDVDKEMLDEDVCLGPNRPGRRGCGYIPLSSFGGEV